MSSNQPTVIVDLTPIDIDLEAVCGPTPTGQDVRDAVRAVVVHSPEQWPSGAFCQNCRARYPCRLAGWGMRVLTGAGWKAARIERMRRQSIRSRRFPERVAS